MTNLAGDLNENIVSLVLQESAQELLGQENLRRFTAGLSNGISKNAVDAQQAGLLIAPDATGKFFQALEDAYGLPGSRGLAVRIGRSSFKYALSYAGDRLGLRAMNFRLLPAPRRVHAGLEILAGEFGRLCSMDSTIQETGADWRLRLSGRSLAAEQAGSGSLCYLIIGMLQEFMTWAGGGRLYRVTEAECTVTGGSACVFRIEKKPFD